MQFTFFVINIDLVPNRQGYDEIIKIKVYGIRKERAKDESLWIVFKERKKRSLNGHQGGSSKHVRKRIKVVWPHRSQGKEKWSTIKFLLA